MSKFNVTKEDIDDYMRNYEDKFPSEIPSDAGLVNNGALVTVLSNSYHNPNRTSKRRVTLEITSFRGLCAEAEHYYGKLRAEGVYFVEKDNPRIISLTDFAAKKTNPFYQYSYDFDLYRLVTQREIDENPSRWEDYFPDDFTTSFESKADIINLAVQLFKLRFTGEWELWLNDQTTLNREKHKIEL